MKNIVICGDSFNIGLGCRDLKNEPYGSLLAKELNLNLINLAKGSSTNFSIFLQVKYAIEHINDISLMIVSPTSHDRIEFFTEKAQYDNTITTIDNTCVNYHQYPPYNNYSYLNDQFLENPIKYPKYNPIMYTENFGGIFEYIDFINNSSDVNYYQRYKNEDINRLKIIKDYSIQIWNYNIQKWYNIGIINMAHTLLLKKQIQHIIINDELEMLEMLPDENKCRISWGELSQKYPDDLPSGHTSAKGHLEVYNSILQKIKN